MWGWSELEWVDRKGCGPAGGQWDDQDGKATAGSVKGCGVRQGSSLPGWGFLRLAGWMCGRRVLWGEKKNLMQKKM